LSCEQRHAKLFPSPAAGDKSGLDKVRDDFLPPVVGLLLNGRGHQFGDFCLLYTDTVQLVPFGSREAFGSFLRHFFVAVALGHLSHF
jgi:hypothetical protein